MEEYQSILRSILVGVESFSALIGIIYLSRLRTSYWKWFSIFLIIIFIQEYFWLENTSEYFISSQTYYIFFGVPIQYIFLYWLYAVKSLNNIKLFIFCSFTYFITLLTIGLTMGLNEVYSKSSNVGTIILTVLIVCEFIKQIKNDDILKFWENKMFYINTAVVLCHIGSYPYNVYGKLLYYKYPQIWDIYNAYFYIASYIMYLLFAASFIWGKKES